MGIRCPKCRHENPDATVYCGQCGRPLDPSEGASLTKTLITPKESLRKGNTLAGRYTIIEELGRGGMGVVYKAEEKTFISMAYIEGQSLKKKIDAGPLELEEAMNFATQVAEGLQEAHKKGVVHRGH